VFAATSSPRVRDIRGRIPNALSGWSRISPFARWLRWIRLAALPLLRAACAGDARLPRAYRPRFVAASPGARSLSTLCTGQRGPVDSRPSAPESASRRKASGRT